MNQIKRQPLRKAGHRLDDPCLFLGRSGPNLVL